MSIMDKKTGDPIEHIPMRDLKIESEAEELLESAAMEPYMTLAIAIMGGKDTGPAIEELAALPSKSGTSGALLPP